MTIRTESSDTWRETNVRRRNSLRSSNLDTPRNNGETCSESTEADPDQGEKGSGPFGLGSDLFSVMVLMVLYILQGIPLGLSSSVPILIQNKIENYSQQAAFSIVSYPFSMKLLWAPIVDCFYSKRLGRRKTWLVPLQFAIGVVMLYIPSVVEEALGNKGGELNIAVLAGWFCFLTFLAATQDIAVDGWALTMLSKRNVGWASTCNSVGQTIGFFFGYLGFLALDSPMFCNMFRKEKANTGCVTMESYLMFWGVVFIATTTFVMIFVKEKEVAEDEENESCGQTYFNMLKILKMKNVLWYTGSIFIIKAAFAPMDALSGLKLLEAGLSKDVLVSLSAFLIPLQIILPLIITKYTSSSFPLQTYIHGVLPRMLGVVLASLLVFYGFSYRSYDATFYVVGILIQILYSVASTMMFVSQMMFNAKVSDVRMGGTYMTLLNTLINLSGTLPQTLMLWAVDRVTISSCVNYRYNVYHPPSCYMQKERCIAAGGKCQTDIDGYFVLIFVGLIIATFWRMKICRRFQSLQYKAVSSWHV